LALVGDALELSRRAGTLVLQPTPLCNLRCTYCYLPDLSDRARMDPTIPRRLAADLATYPAGHRVEVVWHGGEPLTVGVDHFTALLEPFEPLRRVGQITHSLQTNATLITEEWCRLFERYDVGIGVSIDGPRWANRERRTLSGAETFERVLTGLDLLGAYHRSFSAIAVVTSAAIPTIVERASEYFGFFASIGAQEVGFNIAETEGHHTADPVPEEVVEAFWKAGVDFWLRAEGKPKVRDFTRVARFVAASLDGAHRQPVRDIFPTVTCRGEVVVLSPELAGHRDERYADFVVGNVLDEPLSVILERALAASYVREFLDGTKRCRATCPYFDFCLGGEASNRYFENGGDFTANETSYCRNARQIPFTTVVAGSDIA
jgi:uncharacterized protein